MKTKEEKAAYMKEWYIKNKAKKNVKKAGRKGVSYKTLYYEAMNDSKEYIKEVDKELRAAYSTNWYVGAAIAVVAFIAGYLIK